MCAEGARLLALALRSQRHSGSALTCLDLEENGIGTEGAVALADALRSDHSVLTQVRLLARD